VPAPAVSPIVAALDHPDVRLAPEITPIAALSLVAALSEVPDPRKPRGIRHGVLAILLLGACAVLTGARSFAAIAEYAHDTGRAILDLLGVGLVVPHESTIRRVLQDLDPDAVEAALRTWALAQLADRPAPGGVPMREQRQVLALDGKTVRGAHIPTATIATTATTTDGGTDVGTGGYRQPHLVSVLDQASGVVLGQIQVAAKGSEVAAFTTLLDELDLTDVLVTADALCRARHKASYEDVAVMPMCWPGLLLVAATWAVRSA
jgi:DDE_Tnp_1-associated/Transposase DDE domain